jgi:hypothetical protein
MTVLLDRVASSTHAAAAFAAASRHCRLLAGRIVDRQAAGHASGGVPLGRRGARAAVGGRRGKVGPVPRAEHGAAGCPAGECRIDDA